MKNKKILCSLFIPSLLTIYEANKNILFIPINRGLMVFVERGNSLNFINIKNNEIINDVYFFYGDLLEKISVTFYSEVPAIWQLNIMYSIILAMEIIKKVINNGKLKLSSIIKDCIERTKGKEYSPIPFLAYKFKKGAILKKNEKNIEPMEILNDSIFIICFKEEKHKVQDFTNIQLDIYEKSMQKIGNTEIYKTNKVELAGNIEELINTYKPENILIARYYTEGIKIYRQNKKIDP